jgi:hypothetical protein
MNMARRAGASARTQALARAAEAVARRDAERVEREKRLQSVLADYFHAQGEAERIQREAEVAAASFNASIRDALRTLENLRESRAGIAQLTGLSLARVREYLADTPMDGAAEAAPVLAGAPVEPTDRMSDGAPDDEASVSTARSTRPPAVS